MTQQNNHLLQQLKDIASLPLGAKQALYYAWLVKHAFECKVQSLQSLAVNHPKFVSKLLSANFQQHECYRNAIEVIQLAIECNDPWLEVKYVEGQFDANIGIGLDHAWNKIIDWTEGSEAVYYVDVTAELVLKQQNIADNCYIVFKEFEAPEMFKLLMQSKFYGTVFPTWFANNVAHIAND